MYSSRDMLRITMTGQKLPLNKVEEVGVNHASRDTRCRVLKKIFPVKKPKTRSPLSQFNKNKSYMGEEIG